MKKKKNLITYGEPCRPFNFKNIRFYTKEELEGFIPLFEELKHQGEITSYHMSRRVTAHEYYDYMIKENELLENYEECNRLKQLKVSTPYSEELTHTLSRG